MVRVVLFLFTQVFRNAKRLFECFLVCAQRSITVHYEHLIARLHCVYRTPIIKQLNILYSEPHLLTAHIHLIPFLLLILIIQLIQVQIQLILPLILFGLILPQLIVILYGTEKCL